MSMCSFFVLPTRAFTALLTVFVLCLSSTSARRVAVPVEVDAPAEMPWFQAVQSFHFPKLYAADFGDTKTSILPSLLNSTAEFVLVDFYAPWCPHCQHFAPDFERLALAIQKSSAGAPRVLTATLDCVRYAATCEEWGINGFPTLLWGHREDWLHQNRSRLEEIEVDPRTAESVAAWITNRSRLVLNTSAISRSDVVKLIHEHSVAAATAENSPNLQAELTGTVDPWDVQLAAALFIHQALAQHAFSLPGKALGAQNVMSAEALAQNASERGESWKALVDFAALLATNFPEPTDSSLHATNGSKTPCRASLKQLHAELSSQSDSLRQNVDMPDGPAFYIDPEMLEGKWQFCGLSWDKFRRGWGSCHGTWPGKRGYTCGLWSMFHTLMGHSSDKNALQDTNTIRAAIQNFFDCTECRDHFFLIPFEGDRDASTLRSAKLWWWQAHNIANERVRKLELEYGDGDPGYPKQQWPGNDDCPTCRSGFAKSFLHTKTSAIPDSNATVIRAPEEDWNHDEVIHFISHFYGYEL